MSVTVLHPAESVDFAYLIKGGAPAGISILPGEDGCRTMRMRINIITMSGNKITTPRGIDIFEFPFNLIRLLKKANLGDSRSFCRAIFSRDGRLGEEGIRFTSFCTNPMDATDESVTLEAGL